MKILRAIASQERKLKSWKKEERIDSEGVVTFDRVHVTDTFV